MIPGISLVLMVANPGFHTTNRTIPAATSVIAPDENLLAPVSRLVIATSITAATAIISLRTFLITVTVYSYYYRLTATPDVWACLNGLITRFPSHRSARTKEWALASTSMPAVFCPLNYLHIFIRSSQHDCESRADHYVMLGIDKLSPTNVRFLIKNLTKTGF